MAEVKKDIVHDWIHFKLMEAVKKDPLYKDTKEKKAVMKNEETDVHDGISDMLLRVLSKDDIAKLNYINGFNPERDIHNEVIPNKKKEKIKESVSLKEEDSDNNMFGGIEPTEDIDDASDKNNDTSEEDEELDATLDINDEENKDSEEAEDESLDDEESLKNKGVGAFDRILKDCEKDEILSKAISALNASDISSARKEFYEWFDSFDDEHAGKEDEEDAIDLDSGSDEGEEESGESGESEETNNKKETSEEEPEGKESEEDTDEESEKSNDIDDIFS